MNFRSPVQKLVLAAVLLVALLGAAVASSGVSFTSAARLVLGLAAIAGLGVWLHRSRRAADGSAPQPRLQVRSRAALSNRAGLALVQVDGVEFLVVHGEGYAQLQPLGDAPRLSPEDTDRFKAHVPRRRTFRSVFSES